MKIKASTVVLSQLSDLGFEVMSNYQDKSVMETRVSFCKWLILHLGGDLNKEIDIYVKYAEFTKLREETI